MLIFFATILISTVLTQCREVAWRGYPERWHGIRTWSSYFILMCYMLTTILHKSDKLKVLRVILYSSLVVSLVGVFQFVGMDPFRTEFFFKMLILPIDYFNMYGTEGVKFTFEVNRVYSTLYNPNNVGFYSSIVLLLSLYSISIEKKVATTN